MPLRCTHQSVTVFCAPKTTTVSLYRLKTQNSSSRSHLLAITFLAWSSSYATSSCSSRYGSCSSHALETSRLQRLKPRPRPRQRPTPFHRHEQAWRGVRSQLTPNPRPRPTPFHQHLGTRHRAPAKIPPSTTARRSTLRLQRTIKQTRLSQLQQQ